MMLNNIKIDSKNLQDDQKFIIFEKLTKQKDITFKGLRKLLQLDKNVHINFREDEKLNNFKGYHDIKKAFTEGKNSTQCTEIWEKLNPIPDNDIKSWDDFTRTSWDEINTKTDKPSPMLSIALKIHALDLIAEAVTYCKSDDNIKEYLKGKSSTWEEAHKGDQTPPFFKFLEKLDVTLTDDAKDKIIEQICDIEMSGTANLSTKAARKLTPYLIEKNITYDKAVREVYGMPERNVGKLNVLPRLDKCERTEITNPVVLRAIYRCREVVNAIIRQYGMPTKIKIELARELAHGKNKRAIIEKGQKEFKKVKDEVFKKFEEKFDREPIKDQLLKYRLFLEQDGKCIYSGEKLSPGEDLFYETEVDHIIPYSRSFDNTLNNKVLCLASENRDKGKQTPFEYFGGVEERWKAFEKRVNDNIKRRVKPNEKIKKAKSSRLLEQNFDEEKEKKFKQRNLTDTQYMSRFLKNYLEKHLNFGDARKNRVNVVAVNGRITAELRRSWKFEEKKLDKRETGDTHHAIDAAVIAAATPRNIKRISKYYSDKEENKLKTGKQDKKPKEHAPKPWESFRCDVLDHKRKLTVSRWFKSRRTGATNKETVYSKWTGDVEASTKKKSDSLVHYTFLKGIESEDGLAKTVVAKTVVAKKVYSAMKKYFEDNKYKFPHGCFAWKSVEGDIIKDVTDEWAKLSKKWAKLSKTEQKKKEKDEGINVIRELKMTESQTYRLLADIEGKSSLAKTEVAKKVVAKKIYSAMKKYFEDNKYKFPHGRFAWKSVKGDIIDVTDEWAKLSKTDRKQKKKDERINVIRELKMTESQTYRPLADIEGEDSLTETVVAKKDGYESDKYESDKYVKHLTEVYSAMKEYFEKNKFPHGCFAWRESVKGDIIDVTDKWVKQKMKDEGINVIRKLKMTESQTYRPLADIEGEDSLTETVVAETVVAKKVYSAMKKYFEDNKYKFPHGCFAWKSVKGDIIGVTDEWAKLSKTDQKQKKKDEGINVIRKLKMTESQTYRPLADIEGEDSLTETVVAETVVAKKVYSAMEKYFKKKKYKFPHGCFAWRKSVEGDIIGVTDEWVLSKTDQKQKMKNERINVIRKLKMTESLETYRMLADRGYAANGDMLRIDVFRKLNKRNKYEHYAVPLYAHHVTEKDLFSKACTRGKKEEDWPEIDDSFEFLFSLCRDEMIEIERKDRLYRGYYNSFKRTNAQIDMAGHDRYTIHAAEFEEDFRERLPEKDEFVLRKSLLNKAGLMQSIGIMTAKLFRKVRISVLGDRVESVKWEERQPLRKGQVVPSHQKPEKARGFLMT